jgi:tRNA pseudouridine13 synthase
MATTLLTAGGTLPFLTPSLAGIGGKLKAEPGHFIVTEICGSRNDVVHEATNSNGKHAFVTLKRERMTTQEVLQALADIFGCKSDEIGYAGLKDKFAIATQTFSLPRDRLQPVDLRKSEGLITIAGMLREDTRWQLLEHPAPAWHQAKLKKGELTGNHFDIIVSDIELPRAEALARAQAVAASLRTTGWANFFGPQRFGKAGPSRALQRGTELLKGRSTGGGGGGGADGGKWRKKQSHAAWLDTLLLNGMQSAVFNEYIAERMERGWWGTILLGDLVTQPLSGGKPRMVRRKDGGAEEEEGAREQQQQQEEVEAEATEEAATLTASSSSSREAKMAELPIEENEMIQAFTLSHTGPLFGGNMPKPGGLPAKLEADVWERCVPEVKLSHLKRTSLWGARRVCRLALPADFRVEEAPGDASALRFCFSLPRGAYATSLLREFMKCDDAVALGEAEHEEQEAEGAGGGGGATAGEAEEESTLDGEGSLAKRARTG